MMMMMMILVLLLIVYPFIPHIPTQFARLCLPGFLVDASRCDETPAHHLPRSPAGSPDISLGSSDVAQQLGQRRNSQPATRFGRLSSWRCRMGLVVFVPNPFETYASSSKIGSSYPTNRGENTTESMKMVETVQPTAVLISAMIPKNNGKTHAAKKSTQKKTWKPLVGVVGEFVPNGSSENFVVFRIHLSAESLSWNMPGVCRISVQHPGKLTWNPEMEVWKMIFLSKWVSLMFQLLIQGWRLSACHFLVEGVGI